MRRQVAELLARRASSGGAQKRRKRPLWKLLAALEHAREQHVPDSGLPSWPELRAHWRDAAAGQAEAMKQVLAQWNEHAEAGLQSVTQSEVAALAEFALSGPGVVLGRALYRFDPNCIKAKITACFWTQAGTDCAPT